MVYIVLLLLQINVLLKLFKIFLIVLKNQEQLKLEQMHFKTAGFVAKLDNNDKSISVTSQNTSKKSIMPMQTKNMSKIPKKRNIPLKKGQQIFGELMTLENIKSFR